MRIGEAKCSVCDTVTMLTKGMCQKHYVNNANKIKRRMTKISERKCEICDVYAVLIRGLCPMCYPKFSKLRNRPEEVKKIIKYENNNNK
jgi:hypothetical protein